MRPVQRSILSLVSVLLLSAAVTAVIAPSAAAQTAIGAVPTKYCLTVVERIKPGQPDSRVVSHTCSDRHAAGSLLPDGVVTTLQLTLLVTFFQHSNYGGAWDTVGGQSGPCDTAGYGFSNLSLVNFNVNGISSYQLNNNCHVADYWTGTSYTGTGRFGYRGNNSYVGAQWNDNLLSMKVRA